MQGYWMILGGEVLDKVAQDKYSELWKPIATRYAAKINILDTASVLHETQGYSRVVIVAFESYSEALECYLDNEYQIAKALAVQASRRELLILKGPPPGI